MDYSVYKGSPLLESLLGTAFQMHGAFELYEEEKRKRHELEKFWAKHKSRLNEQADVFAYGAQQGYNLQRDFLKDRDQVDKWLNTKGDKRKFGLTDEKVLFPWTNYSDDFGDPKKPLTIAARRVFTESKTKNALVESFKNRAGDPISTFNNINLGTSLKLYNKNDILWTDKHTKEFKDNIGYTNSTFRIGKKPELKNPYSEQPIQASDLYKNAYKKKPYVSTKIEELPIGDPFREPSPVKKRAKSVSSSSTQSLSPVRGRSPGPTLAPLGLAYVPSRSPSPISLPILSPSPAPKPIITFDDNIIDFDAPKSQGVDLMTAFPKKKKTKK